MNELPIPAKSESALLRSADALLQAGQYEEAHATLEQVLKMDPRNVRGWLLQGELLRRTGKSRLALAAFQRALTYDPHDDWLLGRISETYRDLGQPEDALAYLERALQLNPDSVFALAVKGEILRANGENRAAIALLDRALELNMRRATEAAKHADQLRANRHYEEGLRAFDLAVSHYTHSCWVLTGKAEALHAEGECAEALQTTDIALETRERHLELLHEKAEMLRRVGQFDDALGCYDEAQAILKGSGRLLGVRALILTDLRRYAEADLHFIEAIEQAPETAFWWLRRGGLLLTMQHYDEARLCLEQALDLEPQNVEIIATYIELLCVTGNYTRARGYLTGDAALPNDDWFLFLQSIVEIYTTTPERGRTLLKEAVRRAAEGWRQTNNREERLHYLGNLALYHLVGEHESRARELYEKFRNEASPRQCMEAVHDLEFAWRCGLVRSDISEFVAFLS